MSCVYKYKGKDYTKEEFYSLVRTTMVQPRTVQKYEKVLFPTGNTASKVEGHTTLEEFKKEKEDRIKELENYLINVDKLIEDETEKVYKFKRLRFDGTYSSYSDKQIAQDSIERIKKSTIDEINQLKQELENLEKEGFGALKPIYNFYENTVTNILNKVYGKDNVNQATDEYGNTWNEITLEESLATTPILLQKETPTKQVPASPQAIKFIKDFLKRVGVDYAKVSKIVVNGKKIDANGVADMMQKLIQVIDGKEAEALPEEAMHFAVEILEQTNPKLFNKLMQEINGYAVYKEVLAVYGKNPLYQDANGKPDIRKLKKEAIGKVLANVLVNKLDGVDTNEKVANVQSWWREILTYLKSLFVKSGFDIAAIKIMKGEDIGTADNLSGIYLQQGSDPITPEQQAGIDKQSKIFEKLNQAKTLIDKREDGYYLGGNKIARVSDLVDNWYNRRFAEKALDQDEFTDAINDLKRENGDLGHKEMEHIFDMFIDENGYVRDTQLSDDNYVSLLNKDNRSMYITLRDNFKDRISSLSPDGRTRFLKETIIFDERRKLAGTVDFMAITSTGKIHILDWKFMDINENKFSDVPWYKVAAWDIQMTQYKYIISNMTATKSDEFGQTRMIPIQAIYSKADFNKKTLPVLLDVKIGDVNVKNIVEDFLLPVGLSKEKTGIRKIDDLLVKLNAIYKKLSEEKVLPSEKQNKAEQLNALYRAIRILQVKQDIRPLLNQVKILNKQIKYLFEKYDNEFRNFSKDEIDSDKISGFAALLRINLESLEPYLDLNRELKFLFEGTEDEDEIELREDLRDTVDKVYDYKRDLQDLDKEFGEKFNNADYTAEKCIKGITKWFSSAATLQVRNIQTLFVKANRAIALSNKENLVQVKTLTELRNNYSKWAASKGLNLRNQFNILMKPNTNELIDEFKSEFYTQLKKKINEKDFAWIKANVDVEAYTEYLKEAKQKEAERIANRPTPDTGILAKLIIREEINKLDARYSLFLEGNGWLRYNDIKKFPKKELWNSEEWKTLTRPENAPAKDFYDYIIERNAVYRDIGYINAVEARVFLPWVRKGLTETVVFGGQMALAEQTLRNISVDENDIGLGRINPLTNEPINSVPIYYTNKIDEGQYSTDLFKTMAMYNEQAIRYKNLVAIEEQALQLLRAERNKKSIQTSIFNKPLQSEGIIKESDDNSTNASLLKDMITGIIYQQRFVESEAFDQALFKFKSFGKKINTKLGFKLLPEDLEGRQISVNKSISFLNNTFQLNTLGLNPLSALSNLLGAGFQAYINSGNYFTKEDLFKTQLWIFGNKMGGADKQKALAALDYFVPFTDNYNRYATKKLSLNKLSDEAVQDFIMVMMRNSDEAIQRINFFAYINNSIVQDGKVQNAREYLRKTDEYKNFYDGTFEDRKERAAKFEKDVEALVEEKGILKLSSVVDGKLVIPGVDENSDSVIELRRKVQQVNSDALGNLTEENKRIVNMNIAGTSLMVFKNWIPRLADVRFGNIKYNSASDAYEWGRSRMVFRMLSINVIKSIARLRNSLVANDKGIEYMRELFEQKKADYLADTGKVLEMTETEFINLVRQNIRSQAIDLVFYLTLMSIYAGLKALAPDDEDPIVRNQYKFLMKASDKLADEIGYFYDFTAPFDLISRGIFPTIGLVENYGKLVKNFMINNYALIIGDDELEKDTKVLKYLMKSFPIANQAASMLPMFYPDMAKDLGIQVQSKYQ